MKQDLNALQSLFLLYRERSVTRAATIAGVTQPSMSRTLQKLRDQYQDRLFVRQKDELIPTPKTELLVSKLAPLFEEIHQTLDAVEPLEPQQARGRFAFCAPDFVSKFGMSHLPTGILTTAPNMEFSYSYWSDDVAAKLKSGDLDLAFGYLPECPNHVKESVLSEDQLYFYCRRGHPLESDSQGVSESQLLEFPHIVIKGSGLDDDCAYDRQLAARGLQRSRIVTTPDIDAAFSLLQRSDYIVLAPAQLAGYLANDVVQLNTSWFNSPLNYKLYWGAIKDQDKLHGYIREIITQTFRQRWFSQPALIND